MEMETFELESQLDLFAETSENNQNEIHNKVPTNCLECHGQILPSFNTKDITDGGILTAGEIRVLFINSTHHATIVSTNNCNVKLLGYTFDPDLGILEHQSILFQMARKLFFTLESNALKLNSTVGGNSKTENHDYFHIREELCTFFSFLRSFLLSISSKEDNMWIVEEIIPPLLRQLKQWRLLIQGFTRLPNFVISNCSSKLGNKCTLASHHLFHAHMELRWYHLTLLYTISKFETPRTSEARSELESDFNLFLTELVYLSEGCFSSLEGIDKFSRNSPFPCTCVREIWLLLQVLADKMYYQNCISLPFWGLLEKVLRTPISEKKNAPKEADIIDCSKLTLLKLTLKNEDRPTLCLWLYLHLATLYGYSEKGLYLNVKRTLPGQESGELLELILRAALPTNEELKEAKLREIMRALLVLPTWWPTGISPLLVLWEVFLRKIQSAFLLPSEPPSMLAIINKSASGFAAQLKGNLKPIEFIEDGENSFSLFLKLLGHQISSVLDDEESKQRAWKQLKGRIYPKFPENRMQTMSELGLHHLTSLMLTMALAVDMEEVGSKLQLMLGYCKTRETSKRIVVWRAHLTLLFLQAEQGRNLTASAEPMVRLVEEVCSKMTQFSSPEQDLMRTYIEALQDISEVAPKRNIDLHTLVGTWLSKYLAVCNTTDTCRTLDAMQALASRISGFTPDQINPMEDRELFSCLKKHLLPTLMEQSLLQNPPTQKIADLGVTLTLGSDNADFSHFFTHFVASENVNVRITARYLTHILPNEEAMNRVKSKVPNYHNIIIQAWVKCCVLAGESRTEILQLTQGVAKLPQMVALCGGNTDLLVDTDEPLDALAQTLASRLQSIQNLREKLQLKEQTLACLGRIDRLAEVVLKYGKLSSATILRLYNCTGSLVQSCALLIYTKSQTNCLMKGLISHLLLPMSIRNPDNRLSPDIAAALKLTLPMFMRGIASLGPKQDGYINRTIRELVEQYVPRLAPTEHGVHHPLKTCLEGNTDLTTSILDSMRVLFFLKKGKTLPTGATQALKLLHQVVIEKYDDLELVRNVAQIVLEPLLYLLLYLEEKSMGKHIVSDTVKEILNCDAFRDSPEIHGILDSKLPTVYRNLGFHAAPLFRLLQWMASMRRGLLIPTLPVLRAEIVKVENLRGTGRDTSLRSSLEKLEIQLGVVSMDLK